MRKLGALLGLAVLGFACLLIRPGSVSAQGTPVADQPGSTLLLPYFEVALPKGLTGKAKGLNTLFSVNNASASATMAHVTIWSDLSVPVLAFDVYLTGFDVQTFDLAAIFTGTLPATASAGQDPGDLVSNHGPISQDINFASCFGLLPFTAMPPEYIAHVQAALTGKPTPFYGGLCAGLDHHDRVARGYVTVDVTNACNLLFPSDVGYFFSGGGGIAGNRNILWGDYFYLDVKGKVGRGSPLVHIRASATDPQTSVPGQYTFYGRYVGWTAIDNREPLSTNFVTRFVSPTAKDKLFPTGTSLIVWRDSKVNQGPFNCATKPAWYPLNQEGIVAFNEQEDPEIPQPIPLAPQPPNPGLLPFPAEAQRVPIDGPDFPVSFNSGWIYLNLNTTVAAAGANPPEDPAAAQAWVTTVHDSKGRYSVGYRAVRLDSAEVALHTTPGH
jgi:hypothetical protein